MGVTKTEIFTQQQNRIADLAKAFAHPARVFHAVQSTFARSIMRNRSCGRIYTGIAFDYVITVCDNAREQCPYFPSAGELIHHSFSYPGHTPGEGLVTSFRRVRDEIKAYSREFIHQKLPA